MSDMTDRELLELVVAQVGKLTIGVDNISKEISLFKADTNERLNKIDNLLMTIENEHGSKINALLDGYKQLAEVQEEIRSDVNAIKSKQDKEERIKQFINNIKK